MGHHAGQARIKRATSGSLLASATGSNTYTYRRGPSRGTPAGAGGPLLGAAPAPIGIAIADVRRLIADALATLIARMDGLAVAGVAVTEKALDTVLARRPALLVVGVGTDSPEALSLVRTVRARAPDLKVVMVVDAIEPALVRFTLEQGVSGLLLSDAPAAEIAESLRQVLGGHAVLPAGWQRMISADADSDEAVRSLSERQREVLELVTAGYSYEEIAGRLFISANTVKSHVRSIYAQLGVHNRMAAAHLLAQARH